MGGRIGVIMGDRDLANCWGRMKGKDWGNYWRRGLGELLVKDLGRGLRKRFMGRGLEEGDLSNYWERMGRRIGLIIGDGDLDNYWGRIGERIGGNCWG